MMKDVTPICLKNKWAYDHSCFKLNKKVSYRKRIAR